MNALTHKAFNSSSVIAMGAAISQVVSRQALSVVETIAAPVDIDVAAADNDNSEALPVPFLPANALIERSALTRAVSVIIEAVEKRNTIPILSNLCMSVAGGKLIIAGTDLDLEITATIDAAVDDHFGTTLPAHLMRDLLKKAVASDFVSITTGEYNAKLDFERVDYNLQSLPVGDYQPLTVGAFANEFQMKGADFWALLDGTMEAISKEETRYYLNGIYLHTLDNGNRRTIAATATDGHRLYSQEFELPIEADGMPGVIIPSKTVKVIHKLMKGKACPEMVTVAVSHSKVRVSFDNIVITSKLIDGTFPDYARVVPLHNSKPAHFKASALIEGLESVSLISSERGRAVKISFDEGHGFCLLTVNNPDSGRAEMSIPCQFSGDCLEIGFNASYLIALLKDATMNGGDDVVMMLEDSGSPTLVTSGREDWKGVCMPMRV